MKQLVDFVHRHRLPMVSDFGAETMNTILTAAENAGVPILVHVTNGKDPKPVGRIAAAAASAASAAAKAVASGANGELIGESPTEKKSESDLVYEFAKKFRGRCLVAHAFDAQDPVFRIERRARAVLQGRTWGRF